MYPLRIDPKHKDSLARTGVSRQFEQELRCSHAGETGAVWIYRGILATRPAGTLRAFATEHLKTEQQHLHLFESLRGCYRTSLLLPLWRMAGFLTGFIPALAGKQAVFATIEAVETFVDLHYQGQIQALNRRTQREAERAILNLFEICRLDEVAHRDEATQQRTVTPPRRLILWTTLVGAGSKGAVSLARHL
ncbi:demethoxyubiquinone hydroxylase family protein [Marinobacter caseinilyticus]|uniref:demethoxyubiquinone hydroxylase family protein n=1 Tax=Marinobacter caseinilyticus TaxID=2692195 RepID=UPI00140A08A4|nr:demethoxyubiquinone hydroxylase family protein [Marinobacter caseinilyticus]